MLLNFLTKTFASLLAEEIICFYTIQFGSLGVGFEPMFSMPTECLATLTNALTTRAISPTLKR